MTYDEAMAFIHSFGMNTKKPTLERMERLMSLLGNVQGSLRFVHVAGTNGKGSVCAMTESILRAAGYSTGLYTSPYLRRFNERIRVGGECVSDGEIAWAAGKIAALGSALPEGLSEFEIDTAMAFLIFAKRKCRVVVLETGLGGRFDATNIIGAPDCAVITNIGLDHTKILGSTLAEIASEKAGIIKEGGTVVLYEPDSGEVRREIVSRCREKGASLRIADFEEIEPLGDGIYGQSFSYCMGEELFLPLLGDHQLKNAAVCLECIEVLREKRYKISDEAVKEGLEAVKWPARFELVSEKPYFIVDGGHNVQGAETAAENLEFYFADERRVLLVGIMADKDVEGFVNAVSPVGDAFVCVAPPSPRALSAEKLAGLFSGAGKPVFVCESIANGVETAIRAAGEKGVVCALGSLYMAGDIRAYFGLE